MRERRWKGYTIGSLLFLAATLAVALVTKLWVITAIPIGFLFGFFLQKGDLCGASAFSEVLLARDWRKIQGLWVCIVASMAGFAILELLGLVTLTVKPMYWLNYVVGGILFGGGMVLAGGCVSGCLYKAATGNLNSIAALLAMPFGMALVEYGPLKGLFTDMMTVVTHAPGGKPLGLPALTGIPYWQWTAMFLLATLAGAVLMRRKKGARAIASTTPSQDLPLKVLTRSSNPSTAIASTTSSQGLLLRILTRPWKPWKAGLAIGVLAWFAYLSSAATGRNYPLGVTHGVLYAHALITEHDLVHVYKKAPPSSPQASSASIPNPTPAAPAAKKIVWWLVLLVGAEMLGAFVSGKLSGEARLLPKPPEQTVWAIAGGFLVGAGAVFATGCVIGNILSGWALLSIGMFLFGLVTVLTNWAVTYFYLMGGSLFPEK